MSDPTLSDIDFKNKIALVCSPDSEQPLKVHLDCRFGLPLIFWFRHSSFVFKTFWCVRKGESEHIFMLKWVSGAGTLRDVLTWTNLADETTSVQHISQNYSSLFNLSKVTNENMASNNVSKSLNGKSHHFYEILHKKLFHKSWLVLSTRISKYDDKLKMIFCNLVSK